MHRPTSRLQLPDESSVSKRSFRTTTGTATSERSLAMCSCDGRPGSLQVKRLMSRSNAEWATLAVTPPTRPRKRCLSSCLLRLRQRYGKWRTLPSAVWRARRLGTRFRARISCSLSTARRRHGCDTFLASASLRAAWRQRRRTIPRPRCQPCSKFQRPLVLEPRQNAAESSVGPRSRPFRGYTVFAGAIMETKQRTT